MSVGLINISPNIIISLLIKYSTSGFFKWMCSSPHPETSLKAFNGHSGVGKTNSSAGDLWKQIFLMSLLLALYKIVKKMSSKWCVSKVYC